MKTLKVFLAVGSVLFAASSAALAQAPAKMGINELLAALKPGQWVKVEGTVLKDFSVNCKQIKQLSGDFLDDDWSITAPVRLIDPEKQEIQLLRLPVSIGKNAEFQASTAAFTGFADIKTNMLVEVEGTYLKDGTFLAKEVEDESAKLAAEPNLINEVEIQGKVEKVDVAKRTITIMGITFQVSDRTKIKSVLK